MVFLIIPGALAEEISLEKLNQFAQSQGFDAMAFIRKLLSGEAFASQSLIETLLSMLKENVRQNLAMLLLNLAMPVCVCVVLRLLTNNSDTAFMMNLLCALCCATVLTQAWFAALNQVKDLINSVINATDSLTPVMASAAALTGGSIWMSALTPLSNLCAVAIQRILRDWGLGLCTIAAVVAMSGAVAGQNALARFFDLIKSLARWMLALAVFIYGGMIAAQGMIGAAKDNAAMQTAKMAIENIVPIVGGGVSDAAGSLIVSAGLARKAIGITGVALIVQMCINPAIALGAEALALKLISAVMEPLADGAPSQLIGRFGEIMEIMLAIIISCGFMSAMIPAACASLAGGLLQ